MNVRDILIQTLEPLGYEVTLQGSYGDDQPLPGSFITYVIVNSRDRSFYSNDPIYAEYRIQVVFYSTDFNLIKSVPDQIYEALKAAKFIRQSKGRDVAYNAEHYAWQSDYYYNERS